MLVEVDATELVLVELLEVDNVLLLVEMRLVEIEALVAFNA